MTSHWIRLRGGWEWQVSETDEGHPGRVTLPFVWPTGITGTVRLLRSFQRPSFDTGTEFLCLQMEQVTGLVAVWLNGRELARPAGEYASVVVPLTEGLPRRNLLVLEVRPPEAHAIAARAPWGAIALVIQPAIQGAHGTDVLGEPDGVA